MTKSVLIIGGITVAAVVGIIWWSRRRRSFRTPALTLTAAPPQPKVGFFAGLLGSAAAGACGASGSNLVNKACGGAAGPVVGVAGGFLDKITDPFQKLFS